MRHPPSDGGRSDDGNPDFPALLEVEMGVEERALLREAARLTGIDRPTELLRVALVELVERRRFQSWCEKVDVTEP